MIMRWRKDSDEDDRDTPAEHAPQEGADPDDPGRLGGARHAGESEAPAGRATDAGSGSGSDTGADTGADTGSDTDTDTGADFDADGDRTRAGDSVEPGRRYGEDLTDESPGWTGGGAHRLDPDEPQAEQQAEQRAGTAEGDSAVGDRPAGTTAGETHRDRPADDFGTRAAAGQGGSLTGATVDAPAVDGPPADDRAADDRAADDRAADDRAADDRAADDRAARGWDEGRAEGDRAGDAAAYDRADEDHVTEPVTEPVVVAEREVVVVAEDDRAPAEAGFGGPDRTADGADGTARPAAETGQSLPGEADDAVAVPDLDRVDALLSADEAERLRARWRDLQAAFVDDPRQAVEDADELIGVAIAALQERYQAQRSALADSWRGGDTGDTEALRVTLRRYRRLFEFFVRT
jgi:hypothetical protein